MKISKTNFSTVLVVGTTNGKTKSLRIKTRHINLFKHYIFMIGLTLLILSSIIIFLSFDIRKTQHEREAYTKEIAHLKSQIPVRSDTLKAKDYIQNIEDKLNKINQYLIKRGIEGFTVDNVGSNNEATTDLSPEEMYALYDERLNDVLLGVAFTPIGFPANFRINSGFGYRSNPFGKGRTEFHTGIDFKGRYGDPVKSTADGKIIHAGWHQGYGICVRIKHKNKIETLYAHLSKANVKVGQMVNAGDVIGTIGSTGHSTGPHLHYEVRENGKPMNPRNFLTLK